jgi:hypothetical protein
MELSGIFWFIWRKGKMKKLRIFDHLVQPEKMLCNCLLDHTLPNYDAPGKVYYPMDDIGWVVSEDKIRIEKIRTGKCTYLCWRRDIRNGLEEWMQIGPTNVIARNLDNRLCFMIFPTRFAVLFKDWMSYSSFTKLNDKVMVWKVRKRDFDNFLINETWK